MFTVVCNCEQFLSTLIGTIFETSSNSRTLDETVNNIAIFLVPLGIILIWFLNSLKVLREYERGVIFRLGRLLADPKGPGLIWVFWPIDRIVRVSLRTIVMDVPTQDVITSRSEEHTSELQSRGHLVCRLLLEKKKHQTR